MPISASICSDLRPGCADRAPSRSLPAAMRARTLELRIPHCRPTQALREWHPGVVLNQPLAAALAAPETSSPPRPAPGCRARSPPRSGSAVRGSAAAARCPRARCSASACGSRSRLFNTSQRGLAASSAAEFLELADDRARIPHRVGRGVQRRDIHQMQQHAACAADASGSGSPGRRLPRRPR